MRAPKQEKKNDVVDEVLRLDRADKHVEMFLYLKSAKYENGDILYCLGQLATTGRFQSAYIVAKLLAGAKLNNPLVDLARALGGVIFGNSADEADGAKHLAKSIGRITPDQRETFRESIADPIFRHAMSEEVVGQNRDREARLLRIRQVAAGSSIAPVGASNIVAPEGVLAEHNEVVSKLLRLDRVNDHVGMFLYLKGIKYEVRDVLYCLGQFSTTGKFQSAYILAKLLAGANVSNPVVDLACGVGGILFDNSSDELQAVDRLIRSVGRLTRGQLETFRQSVAIPVFREIKSKELIGQNRHLETRFNRLWQIAMSPHGAQSEGANPPPDSSGVVHSTAPLEGILFQGQSNAGAGGSHRSTLTAPLFPRYVVTLNTGGMTLGSRGEPRFATDFVTYKDPSEGQAPLYSATAMGFALERWDRDDHRKSAGRFVHTNWQPGAEITSFTRGTRSWTNLINTSMAFTDIALAHKRIPVIKSVVWIQGEGHTAGYAAALNAYIADLVPFLRCVTGQAANPQFMLMQICDTDISQPRKHRMLNQQVALDQLSVAQTTSGVVLGGPMYCAPLQDDHHGNELGRILVGEVLAYAYDKTTADAAFNPLHPTSITLSGKEIVCHFALPPGGGPLVWDVAWIKEIANYGFTYSDSSGSVSIASVAITASNRVTITLSSDPSKNTNSRLSYAMDEGDDVTKDGWSCSRGQLMSPTKQQSAAHRLGYAVPRYVNHYCVRFTEKLTALPKPSKRAGKPKSRK